MPGCYFSRQENRGVPVVGWTHENEVQQGEEMPGVRPADEEERSDREGVQRWKCASCSLSSTMPQENTERAGQLDAFLGWLLGRASQSACDANGDSRALRKRTAWCRNIRPAIPPCRVKHHTVMADGTYMNHGWRLVIAIDGGNGEVLGFQWCSNESKAAYMALFSRIPAPDVPITDGLRGAESACNVQRCLVHVLRNTRVPDEQAQERGRQGAARTRPQARQGDDGRRGRRMAQGAQRPARQARRSPQGAHHRQTGSHAREGTQVAADARTPAPRPLPIGQTEPGRRAVRVLRSGRPQERRPAAVDDQPAGGRRQRRGQARARPPPGIVGGAYETLPRMGDLHAHGAARPHGARHA